MLKFLLLAFYSWTRTTENYAFIDSLFSMLVTGMEVNLFEINALLLRPIWISIKHSVKKIWPVDFAVYVVFTADGLEVCVSPVHHSLLALLLFLSSSLIHSQTDWVTLVGEMLVLQLSSAWHCPLFTWSFIFTQFRLFMRVLSQCFSFSTKPLDTSVLCGYVCSKQ